MKEGHASRIWSSQEFHRLLTAALEKVENQLCWPEEKLNKFLRVELKRNKKKCLRDYFSKAVWERKKSYCHNDSF